MITSEEITEIRHTQMLIGRNILLFQNIEHILKVIIYFGSGSGTPSNLIKRKNKIDELSFGRLTDINLLEHIESKFNVESNSEITLSYDFLPDDHDFVDTLKYLNKHNDDRNFLVHNFCQRWQLNRSDHREEAMHWLTTQYNSIFEKREVLVKTLLKITERTKDWLADINSEEFDRAINEVNEMKKQDINSDYTISYSRKY
ncbi:MAG: hypothetical protein WC733_01895 [Methylophilus sp.]|jgi:hypothetical protein